MPANGGSRDQVAGMPGPPSAPRSRLRRRRVFPGEERQLAELRRWVASLLPQCPARDDVACVATELGTNAVRHTASGQGGWFGVEITWHQQVVRIAVADGGTLGGGLRVTDDPDAERGRGLQMVEGLSARTGVCGDQHGRLVWADVSWGDAGAADPASPQEPSEAGIRVGQAGLASQFADGWPGARSSHSASSSYRSRQLLALARPALRSPTAQTGRWP
jgi:serine/threonine-protein kinase RsbW